MQNYIWLQVKRNTSTFTVFHHEVFWNLFQKESIFCPAYMLIHYKVIDWHALRINGRCVDRKTAEFFWDRVVHHHSYVTGGVGDHEYFGPPDILVTGLAVILRKRVVFILC